MGRGVLAVVAVVRTILTEASTSPALRGVLQQLMTRTGHALSSPGTAKWPPFVLEVCQGLDGDLDSAAWAAAAVEFAAAAAEVVDDLVDDEWDTRISSPVHAINASVARMAGRLGPERAWRTSELLARRYLDACAGEDYGLLLEAPADVAEELAYEMTRRRSGSLVARASANAAAGRRAPRRAPAGH